MSLDLTEAEAAAVADAAESILKIISFAQGRAESYKARRDELRLVHFPGMKEEVETETNSAKRKREGAFLKLQKEMKKMPKSISAKIQSALEKPARYHNRVYEKRATINGINIYGASVDREECERAFIEDLLRKLGGNGKKSKVSQPKRKDEILFNKFALDWFEKIHKANVIRDTYLKDLAQFKKHIAPYFEKKDIREILTSDCMLFLAEFKTKEIGRTMESCDGLLRQILQFAVDGGLIERHPMAGIKRFKHRRENGVPLSKEEERAFVSAIADTKYSPVFLISLYTGVRPCELSTVKIEGEFIVSRNRKQKDVKRIVYKKIPITPMLRPHLDAIRVVMPVWEDLTSDTQYLNEMFVKFCPGHSLYDLRTTFSTRTQECGVPEQVVQIWMGHAPSTLLGRTYTKFSDEYLLKEGSKVLY